MVMIVLGCSCLAGGCAGPTPRPSATLAQPSLGSISIDCGPYGNDVSDCLAIVAAAAEVVAMSSAPGAHAVVTDTTLAHVTFTIPNGNVASADVVVSPMGAYVGVNAAPVP
jgi:hypothetical protein